MLACQNYMLHGYICTTRASTPMLFMVDALTCQLAKENCETAARLEVPGYFEVLWFSVASSR